MKRRHFIQSSLGGLAIAGIPSVFAKEEQSKHSPNIVLIMTDDQGQWALGCYGNEEIHTPHIDQLASEGIRFTHSYCTSPVCSPSRATFMTGLIPSQHGIHDWINEENEGERAESLVQRFTTLTDVLHANGYECALSGKWHLGDNMTPFRHHDYWFTIPTGGGPYKDARVAFNGEEYTAEGYLSDHITNHAIEFIQQDHSQPFFLNVQYTAPHGPWRHHPTTYLEMYEDCEFNSLPDEPRHPWASAYLGNLGNKDVLKQYFASVSAVDEGVGRIVRTLDELGIRDNTVVVFMSDHGFQCGHNGLFGKGNCSNPRNMYEESVLVPHIVSAPGLLPKFTHGQVNHNYINGHDLMPTLLDIAGASMPDGRYAGRSYLPIMQGKRIAWDNTAYAEYGRARMIRTPEWKYVHRADGGPNEFYDMQSDPNENNNLATVPKYNEQMVEMRKRLFEWFRRYAEGDADPVGHEYLRPDMR